MSCCENYAAALSALADGELSEDEEASLLSHIETCGGCRAHLSELMTLRAVFGELPELDPPSGFAEGVLARIHEDEAGKKKRRRALPRLLAACAAFVLLSAAALRLAPLDGSKSASADSAADSAAEEDYAAACDDTFTYSFAETGAAPADAEEYLDTSLRTGASSGSDLGVIGSADGSTVLLVSAGIAPPVLWSFFGALVLLALLYLCLYRRGRGRALCLALAPLVCVLSDQTVKFLVVNAMTPGETQPLLPPLLQLAHVHNYGAAWSSFSGARWLLVALTAAGMAALVWLLVKIVRHPLGQWSLACVLGGGIGNLIDRVRLGYVVDMFETMFMDFPVFNVADIFVVCGTVGALIYYLAFYSGSDEKNWGRANDGPDPSASK